MTITCDIMVVTAPHACVQELMKENKKLKKILEEYDEQKLHCDELHAANDQVRVSIRGESAPGNGQR